MKNASAIAGQNAGKKLLFVTRTVPFPNSTGARTYVYDFLSHLIQKGYHVELALVDGKPGGRSPVYLLPKSLTELCSVSYREQYRIGRLLIHLKKLKHYLLLPVGLLFYCLSENFRNRWTEYISRISAKCSHTTKINGVKKMAHHLYVKDDIAGDEEIRFIRSLCQHQRPDLIIANYVWLCPVFDGVPSDCNALKIVLTHDVIHQRMKSAAQCDIKWSNSEWTREVESKLLQKADLVLAIQEEDAKEFKTMAPDCKVICMPKAVENKACGSNGVDGRCLFVGSKGIANVDGLEWFINDVWPLVIKQRNDATLHVCGSVCEKFSSSYQNVRFLGRIEELGKQYCDAQVCSIPLRFGSGLKIKLVEALSYGRAIVATSTGVQGINGIANKAAIVADNAEDFAEGIIDLLNDSHKRIKMQTFAENLAKAKFSTSAVYTPILETIDQYIHNQLHRKGDFSTDKCAGM